VRVVKRSGNGGRVALALAAPAQVSAFTLIPRRSVQRFILEGGEVDASGVLAAGRYSFYLRPTPRKRIQMGSAKTFDTLPPNPGAIGYPVGGVPYAPCPDDAHRYGAEGPTALCPLPATAPLTGPRSPAAYLVVVTTPGPVDGATLDSVITRMNLTGSVEGVAARLGALVASLQSDTQTAWAGEVRAW